MYFLYFVAAVFAWYFIGITVFMTAVFLDNTKYFKNTWKDIFWYATTFWPMTLAALLGLYCASLLSSWIKGYKNESKKSAEADQN